MHAYIRAQESKYPGDFDDPWQFIEPQLDTEFRVWCMYVCVCMSGIVISQLWEFLPDDLRSLTIPVVCQGGFCKIPSSQSLYVMTTHLNSTVCLINLLVSYHSSFNQKVNGNIISCLPYI